MRLHSPVCRGVACLLLGLFAWLYASPAFAAERVILREGRPVVVVFPQKVQLTKAPKEGTITAQVSEPLLAAGKEVLQKGAKVILTLGEVKGPGRFSGGKIELTGGKALAADGSEIELRPAITRKGGKRVILSILLLPFTLLGIVHGSAARFKAGETISLEVAKDSEVLVD